MCETTDLIFKYRGFVKVRIKIILKSHIEKTAVFEAKTAVLDKVRVLMTILIKPCSKICGDSENSYTIFAARATFRGEIIFSQESYC